MLRIFGSKDIKNLLLRVFEKKEVAGLSVLDFPAGEGFTSNYLKTKNAKVTSWDIFPEFFKYNNLTCTQADLQKPFPSADKQFDLAIFQEGIEHLPDQLFALKEYNRILKDQATLFVTTPNYSNIRSRFSYLVFESETPKIMPPNELESIWYGKDDRVYLGHIFSLGIMKLRMLALLAGFEIVKIHPTRVNWSSVYLGLIFSPFILFFTFKNYLRAIRKNKALTKQQKKPLWDLVKLNLNLNILLGGHLIVEFKKANTIR